MSDYSTPRGQNADILNAMINGEEYTGEPTSEISALLMQIQGSSTSYSEDERKVAKWLDGKAIYEKTIVVENPEPNGQTVNHGIADIETIVDIHGSLHLNDPDGNVLVAPYPPLAQGWYFAFAFSNKTSIDLRIGQEITALNPTVYVTLQYTKTEE